MNDLTANETTAERAARLLKEPRAKQTVSPEARLYVVLSVRDLGMMLARITKNNNGRVKGHTAGVFYTILSGAERPNQLSSFDLAHFDEKGNLSEVA